MRKLLESSTAIFSSGRMDCLILGDRLVALAFLLWRGRIMMGRSLDY